MASSYDGSVALVGRGKLTESEVGEMKKKLSPLFSSEGDFAASEEDISDILDYTFAMVNNGKQVEYVVKELVGMEMEFCSEETAQKVGAVLAEFLSDVCGQEKAKGSEEPEATIADESSVPDRVGDSKRVVSLKGKTEGNALTMSGALGSKRVGGVAKGNALTMSGALGSSREGKSQPKKKQPQPKVETKERKEVSRNNNRRDGGRGEKNNDRRAHGQRDAAGRHDGRGGRQSRRPGRESAAFDRLTRKDGSGPSERDQYNNGGRGGGQRGRDRGRGQDGRSGGRMSGNRRSREDDFESEQDYVEARRPAGRGGRGRGRGRGGPPSGGKWIRTNDEEAEYHGEDEGYYEGYGQEGGYDESYDNYQNYRAPSWRGGYNSMEFHRGGRGRGRGGRGGRGRRGGRGGGRASYARTEEFDGGGDSTAQNGADGTDAAQSHANEETMDESAEAAVGHPSPMVAANFGGRGSFGGYRGRGRGRGRGRWWRGGGGNNYFAGRSEVVNRIASKTWVRAKESSEPEGNQDANGETAEG